MKKDIEKIYKEAQECSGKYWGELSEILESGEYLTILKKDLIDWNEKHIKKVGIIDSLIEKNMEAPSKEYNSYLEWLDYTGKLDSYLDRSVSYIFMRDLGKRIYEEKTVNKIKDSVDKIKKNVHKKNKKEIGFSDIYNKLKEENSEDTLIWLINKIKDTSKNMPMEIDKTNAIRKIIKIIAGVLMYKMYDESDTKEKDNIDKIIRIGYAYGITYPYIDDLLDAKILTEKEEQEYSNLIKKTFIKGEVPKKSWTSKNKELLTHVHLELEEGFNYIKENQKEENVRDFLDLSYIFFNAQEIDRKKELNKEYENKEIYIPIILKSAISRLIVPVVLGLEEYSFESPIFYYGIYNQLADDFTDLEEDYKNERFTPYTYYVKNQGKTINPFSLYLAVIYHLTHNVYKNNSKIKEIILCRVINSLKRFKKKVGENKFTERMEFLKLRDEELNKVIKRAVNKAKDVEFYDKLLRDTIIKEIDNSILEKKKFKKMVSDMKNEINSFLEVDFIRSELLDAVNYSLKGEGKRLRPIIAWVTGIEGYGLKKENLIPLIKSLEYMHTASLMLDDLPSQDNSDLRRGRITTHKKYNIAVAEIGSLFLTQQGIKQQTELKGVSNKKILELINYSTETIKKMCVGQAMDLDSKGKQLSIGELEEICFYKTGIAFEASVIMPAILGNSTIKEKEYLKRFAKYAGIAFQIKDDMLDSKGQFEQLGKNIGIDEKNNASTFVTVLGYEEAERALFRYYALALDSLKKVNRNVEFLKQLMNYILNREN